MVESGRLPRGCSTFASPSFVFDALVAALCALLVIALWRSLAKRRSHRRGGARGAGAPRLRCAAGHPRVVHRRADRRGLHGHRRVQRRARPWVGRLEQPGQDRPAWRVHRHAAPPRGRQRTGGARLPASRWRSPASRARGAVRPTNPCAPCGSREPHPPAACRRASCSSLGPCRGAPANDEGGAGSGAAGAGLTREPAPCPVRARPSTGRRRSGACRRSRRGACPPVPG